MKLIDKMNEINDEYVDKVLKIDNKEKLMGEKMKERKKVNIWKYIAIPVTCLCVVAFGIIHNYNLKHNDVDIVKTNNKYLTANYSMLLYKETNEYLKNVNLDELDDGETLTIESDDVLDHEEETEYKYCSGKVVVKKVKNGIYEHTIESSCENEASDNVNLTMKVYTNINQNSKYQILSNIRETNNGYVGTLSNYNTVSQGNFSSLEYDGISGIVNLDKKLNITDINLLDNAITGVNTTLYYLDKNYVVVSSGELENSKHIISFYDKKLNLVWTTNMENNGIHFLYETNKELVFVDNFDNQNNDKFIYLNKKDGSVIETKVIDNIALIDLKYDNGYLFGFDFVNTYKINKYDLEGNIISQIDLLNIDGIIHTNSFIGSALGNNVSIYKNKDLVYVFDKDGKLINKVSTVLDDNYTLENYSVSDDYYELTYNNNMQVFVYDNDGNKILKEGNQKKYVKYNLNNKIITSANIDETYGYNRLQELGLALNDVQNYSKIMNSKLFEYTYSSDSNGTIILMLYDYSKSKEEINSNEDNDVLTIEDDNE